MKFILILSTFVVSAFSLDCPAGYILETSVISSDTATVPANNRQTPESIPVSVSGWDEAFIIYTSFLSCSGSADGDGNCLDNETWKRETVASRCNECNTPDEVYPTPDNNLWQSTGIGMNSCSLTDTEDDKIGQCSAVGGTMFALSIKDCCVASMCYVPRNEHDCPDNSVYSISDEDCKCNDGYIPDYDLGFSGLKSCTAPKCPPTYTDFDGYPHPLFKVTDAVSKCNWFGYSSGHSIEIIPPGIVCCYGQEAIEDNNTCEINEIEINGNCYPVTHEEKNDTNPHDCPMGEYWSFMANQGEGGCLPFFPENNDTGDDGSIPSGSSLGNMDKDTGLITSSVDSPGQGDFEDAMSPFLDKAKDVLNSYVLIDLPIQVGTCSNDFKVSFTIFGNSYSIDLNSYFSQINSVLGWISALVIFMFAFAGVLIVLSSGKD